ncbi:BrnT family toxin [Jiella mangrovi]|uniref:BrnT family toxin n=1 Tax=Jiella mangrovi TaxID=2821407 RepID=A0ABS4BN26_9HYPH|nr:BrnT family toxin [Jiella mangrovi]MBP0618129.1 BrnT family toxin [Jiella mangrovi]
MPTFDWDDGKRRWLIEDRQIDLEDMTVLFDGRPRFSYPSQRAGEDRVVSVGEINGRIFAVVWMWRGDVLWLITARRAWKREERQFLTEIGRHL